MKAWGPLFTHFHFQVEEFQEVPAEIIKRTDRRAPKHQISQEPVIVQIHSPDVMDLQVRVPWQYMLKAQYFSSFYPRLIPKPN